MGNSEQLICICKIHHCFFFCLTHSWEYNFFRILWNRTPYCVNWCLVICLGTCQLGMGYNKWKRTCHLQFTGMTWTAISVLRHTVLLLPVHHYNCDYMLILIVESAQMELALPRHASLKFRSWSCYAVSEIKIKKKGNTLFEVSSYYYLAWWRLLLARKPCIVIAICLLVTNWCI